MGTPQARSLELCSPAAQTVLIDAHHAELALAAARAPGRLCILHGAFAYAISAAGRLDEAVFVAALRTGAKVAAFA